MLKCSKRTYSKQHMWPFGLKTSFLRSMNGSGLNLRTRKRITLWYSIQFPYQEQTQNRNRNPTYNCLQKWNKISFLSRQAISTFLVTRWNTARVLANQGRHGNFYYHIHPAVLQDKIGNLVFFCSDGSLYCHYWRIKSDSSDMSAHKPGQPNRFNQISRIQKEPLARDIFSSSHHAVSFSGW